MRERKKKNVVERDEQRRDPARFGARKTELPLYRCRSPLSRLPATVRGVCGFPPLRLNCGCRESLMFCRNKKNRTASRQAGSVGRSNTRKHAGWPWAESLEAQRGGRVASSGAAEGDVPFFSRLYCLVVQLFPFDEMYVAPPLPSLWSAGYWSPGGGGQDVLTVSNGLWAERAKETRTGRGVGVALHVRVVVAAVRFRVCARIKPISAVSLRPPRGRSRTL